MAGHIRTRTQQDGTRSYQARHPGPRGKTVVRTVPAQARRRTVAASPGHRDGQRGVA